MKKSILLLITLSFISLQANPKELWSINKNIDKPESVYFDSESGFVFVSNISGEGTKKDGVGWIQKWKLENGKVKGGDKKWVTGLDAPKGMRAYKGILWVSDITRVVAIDIAKGKVIKKIEVPNAIFLNDVAVDATGAVYVSDTMASQIIKIENDKVSVFAEGDNLESPNGLLVQANELIVAAWGRVHSFSEKASGNLYSLNLNTKEKKLITKTPLGNLDGLEIDSKGNYLVSDWVAGKVFQVKPSGESKAVLEGFKGAADIGFISEKNSILVPAMEENRIVAFTHQPN